MARHIIEIEQKKPCKWTNGQVGYRSHPPFDEIGERSAEEIRQDYLGIIGEEKPDYFDVKVTRVDE
ncbi:hypothetical protein [Methylorubrum extorquens]|uniref:hypothetical protein n=1 Tax=Methylorubrum extorquens TaxID=408 RepID=UPI00209E38D9|nr:hypothetical protein [Methylorubrum extorquens]MCP1540008.1 hypothetical protein [Methylorubrum extorquens]